MHKIILLVAALALAGCASKPAYKAQSIAAEKTAESIEKGLDNLSKDVAKSCAGAEFNPRFDALGDALAGLRVQIGAISTAADADMKALKIEIQKRNISIAGLVLLIVLVGLYALKKHDY